MNDKIKTVIVPQLGVNDSEAKLIEWCISDKDTVSANDVVCTLETTKTIFDVISETSGKIIHLAELDDIVEMNQIIALIGDDLNILKKEKAKYLSKINAVEIDDKELLKSEVKATNKAIALAKKLGIDLSNFTTDGIIKEKDVIEYNNAKKIESKDESSITLEWDKNRTPLIIYSSGRGAITAKECIDLVNEYEVVCFISDNPTDVNLLCELPVYHSSRINEIINLGIKSLAVGGDGKNRIKIYKKYKNLNVDIVNIIHPKSYISPSVKMGKGNYIKSGAIIETNTVIGNCCVIDNGVTIAHDNIIGDGAHIAPGASLGSSINVGKLAVLGIGCSISTNINIGSGSIISVSSSVVSDVPDNVVIEGIPGKIIGERKT